MIVRVFFIFYSTKSSMNNRIFWTRGCVTRCGTLLFSLFKDNKNKFLIFIVTLAKSQKSVNVDGMILYYLHIRNFFICMSHDFTITFLCPY